MDKTVWLAKRNYWVASIGAIISVVSFLLFPFLTVKASVFLPVLGISQSEQSVNAMSLALYQGLLWASPLLVLAVLGVALVFLLRRNPFGLRVPLQVQARWTAVGFVVAGVLSAVCLVVSLLLIQQNAQDTLSFLKIVGADFSITWAFGAYLFLAGLAVIVVAGIIEFISPVKLPSDGGMVAAPHYSQDQ
jgi:hypothetical protein